MVARERDLRRVNYKVCYLIEWQQMGSKPSSSGRSWLPPSICCSNRAGEFRFVSEPRDLKKARSLSEQRDLRRTMRTRTGRMGSGSGSEREWD